MAADTATIDRAGTTLLPGLTDAHVYIALIGAKGDHGSDGWISRAPQEATGRAFRHHRRATAGVEPVVLGVQSSF